MSYEFVDLSFLMQADKPAAVVGVGIRGSNKTPKLKAFADETGFSYLSVSDVQNGTFPDRDARIALAKAIITNGPTAVDMLTGNSLLCTPKHSSTRPKPQEELYRKDAQSNCRTLLRAALILGQSVILDGGNTNPNQRRRTVDFLKDVGKVATLMVIVFPPDLEAAKIANAQDADPMPEDRLIDCYNDFVQYPPSTDERFTFVRTWESLIVPTAQRTPELDRAEIRSPHLPV